MRPITRGIESLGCSVGLPLRLFYHRHQATNMLLSNPSPISLRTYEYGLTVSYSPVISVTVSQISPL
jgi:hypothetical protein